MHSAWKRWAQGSRTQRSSTGAMEHVELDQALDAIINSGFKVL